MFGRLLVCIHKPDQIRFTEESPEKRQARGKRAIGETHRHRDCRKPGLRREHLAIVAGWALQIAYLPRRIAPRRIDYGAHTRLFHCPEDSFTKRDIPRLVIQILARRLTRWCLNCPFQPRFESWLTCTGQPGRFVDAGTRGFNVLTALLFQTVEELEPKLVAYREARARRISETSRH